MEILPLLNNEFLMETLPEDRDTTVLDRIYVPDREMSYSGNIITQMVSDSTLKVRGDFSCDGMIRNSVILALGQIKVGGELENSTLIAKDEITIFSAGGSRVYSGADIVVAEEVHDSLLLAEGAVAAAAARVHAGKLLSCRSIHIGEGFNIKEKFLHLEVGEEKVLHEKIRSAAARLALLQQAYEQLTLNIEAKIRQLIAEDRLQGGSGEIEEIKKQRRTAGEKLEKQKNVLVGLQNFELNDRHEKFIRVDGHLSEGAFVEIDNLFLRSNGISATVFRTDGRQIIHHSAGR